jgi:hypothetical protein
MPWFLGQLAVGISNHRASEVVGVGVDDALLDYADNLDFHVAF